MYFFNAYNRLNAPACLCLLLLQLATASRLQPGSSKAVAEKTSLTKVFWEFFGRLFCLHKKFILAYFFLLFLLCEIIVSIIILSLYCVCVCVIICVWESVTLFPHTPSDSNWELTFGSHIQCERERERGEEGERIADMRETRWERGI